MVKGFIFFRDGKIPFVIENYRMELFTDDSLLDDFCKEYNFKENYILHGQCFDIGIRGRKATFLVENSIGSTCYLRCYTINMFDKDEEYDSIGLQSPSLDEVFRCEYEYIDMVRAGINLAIEPKVVYKVPFGMNDQKYELEFRIGHDNRLGLLEDLDRKCELILPLHTNEIQECYDITNVLHRLAMFMTSHAEVPFKRITLYKQGLKAGWFYCPLISEDIVGGHGGFFHEFLMITHKVLATQQGYEKLLDILNDGLRDKEDPFLLFFMETVEPIYHALNTSDMQLLFDILGIKRYPITKKVEKNKWKELQRQLDEARKKRAIDVFEIINRTKLIPIPPKLDGWYHLYQNTPETIYASNTSIEAFLNLDYAQFIAVKDFLHPEAQYSTEHGVKGEEYDNVIFVISKGWNQYQFETYAPMITKKAVIPSGKQASFERNRNLFYVCCSRPKKRLIFFVTVPIDSTFKSFLVELVGEQNIFTFSQYIERKSIK